MGLSSVKHVRYLWCVYSTILLQLDSYSIVKEGDVEDEQMGAHDCQVFSRSDSLYGSMTPLLGFPDELM